MEMRKQQILEQEFCETVKLIKRSSIEHENTDTTSCAIFT